jgi:predicted amidophosphoribosyltransferase
MEAIDSSEAGQARSERVSETRKASREPGKPARKFCTACGQPIQPSATFCAGCGKSLARAASGADSDRHRATR